MDRNSIKYEPKFVAFLDILGYKSMIDKDKVSSIEIIYKIEKALSGSIEMLKSDFEDKISIKMFSDCFCISFENTSNILQDILPQLAIFQLFLSLEGIFVNGALSKDLHYESDRIIFSKALVKAHNLQEKEKYPRIIIDEGIFDNGERELIFSNEYILKDADNYYFLDYLDLDREPFCSIDADDFIESHKNVILNAVKENFGNSHILAKYRWLSEYHNSRFDCKYNEYDYEKEEIALLSPALKINVPAVFPGFSKS